MAYGAEAVLGCDDALWSADGQDAAAGYDEGRCPLGDIGPRRLPVGSSPGQCATLPPARADRAATCVAAGGS